MAITSCIFCYCISTQARDAEARGNEVGRRKNAHLSLILNIGAIVWWVVVLIIVIVITAFRVSAARCTIDYYDQYYC